MATQTATMERFLSDFRERADDSGLEIGDLLSRTQQDTPADDWEAFLASPADVDKVRSLARSLLGQFRQHIYGYDYPEDSDIPDRLVADRSRTTGLLLDLTIELGLDVTMSDLDGTTDYEDFMIQQGLYVRLPDGSTELAPGMEWNFPDEQGRFLAGPRPPAQDAE